MPKQKPRKKKRDREAAALWKATADIFGETTKALRRVHVAAEGLAEALKPEPEPPVPLGQVLGHLTGAIVSTHGGVTRMDGAIEVQGEIGCIHGVARGRYCHLCKEFN